MTEECPGCGAPASKVVVVETGSTHRSTWGLPPHSALSQYVRMCSDPEKAAMAKRRSSQDVEVYLHAMKDLRDMG